MALHPDKFEVLSNYWIGRVKIDGNEYDAMIFKYENLFCRINGKLIKIDESNILIKNENTLKTVKRLSHQLDYNSWKNTNIGKLSDYHLSDQANIYDLPYYYIRRQKYLKKRI